MTTSAPAARRRAASTVPLALTVVTGFTALVYEVAFQKYLATLLGSHSEATATVLGLFLGGLAIGYAAFGNVVRRLVETESVTGRPASLLRWYGVLEAAIGLYALLFPLLFLAVQAVSVHIPHAGGGAGFALDVMLSAILVLPPTIAMGATIPFLTQALSRSLEHSTRIHALVYACNTAGAFAGALAAGFVLVPRLGLVGVMVAMATLNIAVGIVFALLDRRHQTTAAAPTDDTAAPFPRRDLIGYATVALATGFAMMTAQTAVIRLGAQAFGSSDLTFSMVVAVFVLCIAIGSFLVSAVRRIPRWLLALNQWALVASLIVLYLWLPDTPYFAHRLRILFSTQPEALVLFQVSAFVGLTLLLAGPVVVSGATLPLLFNHLRQRVGGLGSVAGKLYSFNTVGSLLGALLGGYALLFWFDLHLVFRIAIAAVVVSAVILGLLQGGRRSLVATAVAFSLATVTLAGLQPWDPARLSPGLFRAWQALPYSSDPPSEFYSKWWDTTQRIFYRDDPTLSVLVTESQKQGVGPVRSILVNGKSDSATHGDTPTTGLLALLPALFADKVETAFVIGYGTGVTVGELAALDSVREVVVAEISSAVIEAAPLFDFANQGASRSPKVEFLRSDAYRALLRSSEQFDVIVSEPSNPWVTGIEMLYSREFLRAARQRLAPGGVYVQWFHQYSTSAEAVELVLRTYRDAFEHVSVWYGLGRDLLILGFDDPSQALDWQRLQLRANRPDYRAGLRRAEVSDFAGLLAHELMPLGVLHQLPLDGPLQTLLRPRLHDIAARAYFTGVVASLPFSGTDGGAAIGAEHSLLRRYLAASDDESAVLEAAAAEMCKHQSRLCTTLFARWLTVIERPDRNYQQALAQARRSSGAAFGGQFNPNNISPLVSAYLFDSPLPESVSLRDARRATDYLTTFYYHGVPMYTERLLEMWQRCEGDPTLCRQGLIEARALLDLPPSGVPESGDAAN